MDNNLDIMTGDVSNAFPTAPCAEKVWTVAGPEFGRNKGRIVEIIPALYGLATVIRSFHEFLGDTLRRMGFNTSRADQDLWWRKSDDYEGYDYVATHVDDIIIVSKNPTQYMIKLEQEFNIRNIEDSPSYYLGNNIKRILDKYFHTSPAQYIQEALRKYEEEHGLVKKHSTPMGSIRPEDDKSPLLDLK